MLVENQIIKIKWNNNNKDWYESKGYVFTYRYDEFNVKAEDLMKNSTAKVKVICDYCENEYETQYSSYLVGINKNGKNACKHCAGLKTKELSLERRINKNYNRILDICKQNNYILLTDKDKFNDIYNNSLEYICPFHGIVKQNMSNFLQGHLCYKCSRERTGNKLRRNIKDVKTIVLNKNCILFNPEDYTDANTPNLKIKCNNCGYEFVSNIANFRKEKFGCPNCAKKEVGKELKYNFNQVEQIINSKNGNKLLNKDEYINNRTSNLKIRCNCGKIFYTSLANYQFGKNRCNYCSNKISNGEFEIENYLKKNNINYEYQKKFNDCKDKKCLPFDFYLPDYNICIEYDGKQHYECIEHFGGENELQYIQFHDRIKNNYCKNNNIKLIRIPYWNKDNLENILNKEIN